MSNHEIFDEDATECLDFMSMFDKPIGEIALEIALRSIEQDDKISDFRSFSDGMPYLNLWERIRLFNNKRIKKPV